MSLNKTEDSMFTNIVYRLDYPEDKIPKVRKKFCWFSGILLGVVFLLSIVSQFISANNIYWDDTTVHSLFESYCGIISFIIAYVIYREYKSSGERSNLFLFLAFISMGIFDFFHAYSNYSTTLFVWFHTLSAFSGGAYFLWSAVSVKNHTKDPPWLRHLFVVLGITLSIAAAVTISNLPSLLPNVVTIQGRHFTPINVPIMGEFSTSTIIMNILSAVCFFLSGLYFLKYFKATNDVLFHIFSTSALLFFESELLFAFSRLWDPSWWYWHVIKLVIYMGLAIGVAYGFTRTFNELSESRKRLTMTLEELQHAYQHLKDTQNELLESEKLASIGKFAASIAHEIRNPLGAINNSFGIFKRHTQLSDEEHELMEIVDKEIGRLNGIITNFLNFAKPFPLAKTYININNLIDETLALFFIDNGNNSRTIKIHKYYDRGLPEALMDRDAVKQCLWNIFINSIQAMPNGGALTIRTHYAIKNRDNEPREEAIVTIADNGIGVPKEKLYRVFQPFFSTKAKGTGLGLSIVQRIIKKHGGDVSISSAMGRGAKVEIHIPLNQRESIINEENRDGVHIDSR